MIISKINNNTLIFWFLFFCKLFFRIIDPFLNCFRIVRIVIKLIDICVEFDARYGLIKNDNIWELMRLLGHSDVQTTQRYAHLSSQQRDVPEFSWTSD